MTVLTFSKKSQQYRARIKVESINWEDTLIKLRILKLLPLAVGQQADPETGIINLVGPARDLDTATSFLQNTCHDMRVFTLQLGEETLEVSLLGLLDMVSGRVKGEVKYYIDGERLCFVGEEEDVAEAGLYNHVTYDYSGCYRTVWNYEGNPTLIIIKKVCTYHIDLRRKPLLAWRAAFAVGGRVTRGNLL